MLNDFLDKCCQAYYDGKPIISDAEYDALSVNYNKIGSTPKTKIKHPYRMYSLKTVFEKDLHILEYETVQTIKLDGAAVAIYYHDGNLILAMTRGDGTHGEDVTSKFLGNDLVPQKIKCTKGMFQVTGELVAPKTIKNARNYAAGALNLKDDNEFHKRDVTFIVYGNYPYIENSYTLDQYTLDWIGFNTVYNPRINLGIFPSDGVVYRVNDNKKFLELGYTAKHPRGAFALKDKKDVEIKQTRLLDVKWQTGKNGKVTPVAIFDSVVIDDANVNRATLHNPGFIEEHNFNIGDTILVTRSGGVIPKVLGKI